MTWSLIARDPATRQFGIAAFAAYVFAVSWITAGPASMLPATENPAPDVPPHQSTHSLPVCAAIRPAASMT